MDKTNTFHKTLFLKCAALLIIGLISLQSAKATVISYTKSRDGVIFKLDKGLMDIRVCKADIIEVKYTIFDTFPEKNSLVVNNQWEQKTDFTLANNNGQIIITTSKLIVRINKTSNAIIYTNKKGELIASESAENKT